MAVFTACRPPTQHLIDEYALQFKRKTAEINKKWKNFKQTLRPHTLATLENAKNEIKVIQSGANTYKGLGMVG